MKIRLNSINFYDDISPKEEIIDSNENSTRLIPFGKSGIHIKEKNKGSFTSYCGGKVTDACIRKGKNSPSAAIRKKATFAANARKWKHQLGGVLVSDQNKLIPMSTRTDISNLFVDYDTPSNFILKKKKEEEKQEEDLNISDNLDYYFGTNPITTFSTPTISEEDESSKQETTVYDENSINTEKNPDVTEDSQVTISSSSQPGQFSSYVNLDFASANIPDDWRADISPHMGIKGRELGSGFYDCADFVRRVYGERGVTLGTNCRTIYNQTTHFSDIGQAQLGDLIFLKGTQKAERGLGPTQPSHVAIVLDTSQASEGFITIASGNPNEYPAIKKINLNKGYYHNHYLGFGRVKSGRNGMKFQFGGFFPKHITDLFVSTESKNKTIPIDYDALFEETEKTKKPKPQDFLSFLTQDIQQRRQTAQNNKKQEEENPETSVYYIQPDEEPVTQQYAPTYSGSNYNFFKSEFDKYIERDPSAKQFESVLTRIAKCESNFNLTIQNTAGAPAYGWFQFWQDGKVNNITHYSGLDVNSFVQNPQAQISSAIKLVKDILRQFTPRDYQLAQSKGYNTNALIRGAWLGGVGGVRQVLNGTGNPNDSKWYGGKGGGSVKQVMDDEKNLTI